MTELPFKIPDPNFQVPDLMQAIEGWRVWRVAYSPRGFEANLPKLFSVTHSEYYWHPRKAAQAECDRCGDNMPGEECSCGFYSARSLEHLMSMSYHQYDLETANRHGQREVMVLGRIANWGKVVQGSQGWRSQIAYPVRLWVPFEAHHLAAPLKEVYGVEVTLKNVLNARPGSKSPFANPRRTQ